MTHRGILGTLDLALLLLLPSLAQAQDRTSLSRIVEAICEKSDVDGDTFRPKLCSPRCDCDVSGATEAVSCTGSVPGAIVVEAQVPAHDSYCTGACITGITPDIVVLGPCASQSDCPVDSSCWFESVIFGTPPASCMDLTTSCNSSADCPAGYSCNTISRCIKDSGFSCPMEPPATAVVCDTVAASAPYTVVTLTGLDPADDSAVVECNSLKINGQDGLACRDEVEALSGLDCP